MSDPIRIAIAGALGRMGRAIAAAAAADPSLAISGRIDRPGSEAEGMVDAKVALGACDVVVDFSTAAAAADLAEAAARAGVPIVVGPTGFSDDHLRRIDAAAGRVAIVRAANYSLGLNLLLGLVAQAARALPAQDYDIEVFEAHHRRKVDAPSGTALMLGEAAADGRGVALDAVAQRARDGITGPRATGGIGFSVLRGGGIIGEHSVVFAAEDEILTLAHSARDRSLFARGALAAAKWLVGRKPGLYDMQDVLGLTR